MPPSPQVHSRGHAVADQPQDSDRFHYSPQAETPLLNMEPQNQYHVHPPAAIQRRTGMDRATTLSSASLNASLSPIALSMTSSESFSFSSHHVSSLSSSTGFSSELDFTGVSYVENSTPAASSIDKAPPSPRKRRARVASGLRSPSLAHDTRLVDRERLTQLRDYLLQSSERVPNYLPSPRMVIRNAVPSPRLDAIDGVCEDAEDSSFVGVLPTPELTRARSGPRYIEATGRASSAPTEGSMLSCTSTMAGDLVGVMPLDTPNVYLQCEPLTIATSPAMPHESAAVLIEAVRASTLSDDEKCRFLFNHFDAAKRGVLSREGVTAFVYASLVADSIHCYSRVNVHAMVDRLLKGRRDMTYSEFRVTLGHVISKSTPMKDAVKPPVKPLHRAPMQCSGGGVAASPQRHRDTTHAARDDGPWTQRPVNDTPRMSDCSPPVYYRASNVGFQKQSKMVRTYRKYQAGIHWMALYSVVLVAAFSVKALSVPYDPAVGVSIKVAKGFAQVMLVDVLCLLLPLCRNLVTYVRQFASLTSLVPVDRTIDFHKIGGVVMLLAALGHTVAWVWIIHNLRSVPDALWQQSKYTHLAFLRHESLVQLMQRIPLWTGFLMVFIAAVAAPLTHPAIRQGHFNVFWVTHLMFVPFVLLMLAHGIAMWVQPPQAVYWIVPPCLLYVADKQYRRMTICSGKAHIQRVQFSQDTVAVFMDKPSNFDFHPGMYLYLQVPVISRFEWHPFSISSAPHDEWLSVHIRNAGDWTGALHALLQTIQDRNQARGAGAAELETGNANDAVCNYPLVFIDGPLGAPSQHYYRYKSVVFVGAGTGVTPFASILRSIVHQWQTLRCPCCAHMTFPRECQIQKIYFYWIMREHESLAWFTEAMDQLRLLDTEGRLEIHKYVSPRKNAAAAAPALTSTGSHDVEFQDIISGLATKQVTHAGQPNWKHELQRIAEQQHERMVLDQQLELEQLERHEGNGQFSARLNLQAARLRQHETLLMEDIAVYFCGPRPMGSALQDECAQFNHDTSRGSTSVAFDFHSEIF